MMRFFSIGCLLALLSTSVWAQQNINDNPFKQLGQELPTPNDFRTAAGAPGAEYWQNRADYTMDIRLDDENQKIYGEETITYHNDSPDQLYYLWLQLDQNVRAQGSDKSLISTSSFDEMTWLDIKELHNDFEGGFNIESVKNAEGAAMPYTINRTMMRVDLPSPLASGKSVSFSVKWWYNINNRGEFRGRSGFEYFPEEDNYLYTIAQFFPRMCVYNDVDGWQNKQFLGRGEFTVPFGDYEVKLTVPADHVVGSTGVLQNAKQVLSSVQRNRVAEAMENTTTPVMIVTPDEALEAEQAKSEETKTWEFHAENVRDFAFCSSRKFIWDAMAVKFGDRTVLAMSYYPKEGNPLWEQYSTRVVAHTLRTYSAHTFDYPYPVAISVHTDRIGMEYPMICFNGGRPEADGTYTERTKTGMISVIIHEVGHNYFPMIVNSDERQWSWMDEGLNSFLQYLSEMEWDRDYPSRRGPAPKIVDYMKGDKDGITPIMTNSESIPQFGNNAYGKPAAALNILRETILGRELFDYAFKQYSQLWMFKQPTPADLFRTLEDASGTDLDWFWRGWFYTTDHVDIALTDVKWFQLSTQDPEIENPIAARAEEEQPRFIGDIRNRSSIPETVVEGDATMRDFYNEHDPYGVSILDKMEYQAYAERLDQDELAILNKGLNYYELSFKRIGGLVMPIILEFTYNDGTRDVVRIPAEIWRMGDTDISKVFMTEKELVSVALDPFLETADVNTNNNYWPPRIQPSRFELYKSRSRSVPNPIQRQQMVDRLNEAGSDN